MAEKKFQIGQALAWGWAKTKANFWLMVGVALLLVIIGLVPGLLLNRTIWSSNLLTWVLGSLVGVGLIKIVLKIYEGKAASFNDFFSLTLNQFLDYLLASLMLMVITFIGFILLIVPGIIFCLKYQFALYLILDKKLKPWEAIKQSGRITRGHLGLLFGLWLLSILITLVGLLVFGIGILVAMPVVLLAQTYVYKKLS